MTIREELAIASQAIFDEYIGNGYSAASQPTNAEAPILARYRPDFIFSKDGKRVIVEVKYRRNGAIDGQLNEIARKVSELPDTEFRVVYVEDGSQRRFRSYTFPQIQSALDEVEELSRAGQTRPALLLCWSAFEAAARYLHGRTFAKPQTPGRIITELAQRGVITPNEANTARTLANARNALIHGELQVTPTSGDISNLAAIARKVASEKRQKTTS
ncbi:hypothetical protein [Pseudoroseicyclus sp. CXY001]|uniref:hypothetical protein n=1 Tax=Pseudoroseicyclus sp. CXY001 TaxID=3242492 RepID=UPI0035714ADA